MSHFGELLLEARKHARLTQGVLGKKVGVDDSYVSRVERGVYPPPTRDVVLGLADALGLSNKASRLAFFLAAGVASDEDVEGFALVKVEDGHKLRRRRSGSLASPLIEEPAPVSDSVKATTVGQDIDEALAGLSQEEHDRLREILVPHARQLVRMMKMDTGGGR